MIKPVSKRNSWLKWVCAILCVPALIILLGVTPAFEQHESGLENFDPADSTLGLC